MKKNFLLLTLAAMLACATSCQKDDPVVPDPASDPETPDTPQPKVGHFSIGNSTTVAFAPGNVQYNPAAKAWRFAPNQYDFIGKANEEASESYDGWIDFFPWGSGNYPLQRSDKYEDYPEFHDWGENFEGDWFTLNESQANYLLLSRPRHDTLCVPATVCDVKGLLLLPDDWEGPSVVPMYWNSRFESNVYDAESWKEMEMEGAIFLPAAGEVADQGAQYIQVNGYYWVNGEPPTMYNSFLASYAFNATSVWRQTARFYLLRSVRLARIVE